MRVIQKFLTYWAWLLLVHVAVANAEPPLNQQESASRPAPLVELPDDRDLIQIGHLYHHPDAQQTLIPNSENHRYFSQFLTPVETIDLKGGTYWLNLRVHHKQASTRWVLNPLGSYIEKNQAFVFSDEQLQHQQSGQMVPENYLLRYGIPLDLQPTQYYNLWLQIDSRYYSGNPVARFETTEQYAQDKFVDTLWVIGCLGAIFILSLYNFLIYIWTKDKSYLYYAGYLVTTFLGWCAVFGIFNQLFGVIKVTYMMLPFFINIITNTFFYQSFLNLPKHNPMLAKFANSIAWAAFIMVLVSHLLPHWSRYVIVAILNFFWLSTGLIAGIVRLRAGFKPARFFVVGFATVFIGGSAVILPYFGFPRFIYNAYLLSLICQTFDVMFLALALADRINLLRKERQEALEKALQADQLANRVLKEANDKLLDALRISEENQRSKDAFILSVSHELRTPLNAIGASLDQLQHAIGDEVKDLYHYIQFGADRLSAQVENILLLAETDQKEVKPHSREFSLQQLLELLRNQNQSYLYEKPVDLRFELVPNLPKHFMGDDHLILSMLSPVVDNACKYTDSGEVIITVDFRRAQELGERHQLLVFVKDTGPGISVELQQQIFDPFMQASTGYQRTHEGLGLGLAISQRLAKILNAAIDLDSESGKGSCFSFCIPIDCIYEERKASEDAKEISGHALVVEDNDVNAKVLGALLNKLGFTMDLAVNGKEATEVTHLDRYDVVFMDLQMPVMDGFKATEELRKLGVSCPIIAVTANTDYQARIKCWDVGMNDFLGKPVRKDLLQHVLAKWAVAA